MLRGGIHSVMALTIQKFSKQLACQLTIFSDKLPSMEQK
jgi:hypothetical protein